MTLGLRYAPDPLGALWAAASTRSLHGAACACGAGIAGLTMTPARLEEDVLDYLLERFREEPVAGALRRRMSEKKGGFAPWLEALLAEPALEAATASRLRADVEGVCRSIVEPQGGIICA